MTREEAITVLNMVEAHGSLVIQAKEMAIKALKQEPCEDAISRQDALDCLTATGLKKFDFILDARDKIKKLPSVTPQPKTGHWIDDCGGVKCSCCGYCIDDDYYAKAYCTNYGKRGNTMNSFIEDQRRLATEELKTVIALLLGLGVNPVEIEAVVDDVLYLKGE
jgi:hypothetical protein